MNYLKERAQEWIEPDMAMYFVGCNLGIFPPPDSELSGYRAVKKILWSSNDIEETLELVIKRLYRNNILLFNEDTQKYKWNDNFSLVNEI
ncbi:MAG: hypothetical protein OEZ39_12050 [Gammaproteobacteria bacterium]|nr:hypothetical protein [Gammaproteobacteria bacterium]MDH5652576.1 hypothetical protein [Gammaproteobacteria bacterium]